MSRESTQLEALVQANPEAQLVATADGTILSANAAACELLEGMGVAVGGRVPFAIEPSKRLDVEFETPAGLLIAEVRSVPIVWLGQAAFLASIRDLTTRHRLSEELHAAYRLEALARLAGGIAHDFNNLMTVIVSASDALRGGLQPEAERAQRAQEIVDATERARALTQQLLAFSRHDYAKTRLVRLDDVLSELEAPMTGALVAGSELLLDLPNEPIHVRVDPTLFAQVVMALAQNAATAMPEGGRLRVRVRTVDGQEGLPRFVKISFEDTGCGISPAHLVHVFEPFFTTDTTGKHVGLGLSTCYGILRKAGGSIEVESTPGAGSTFTAFLPTSEPPPPETQDADVAASSAAQTTLLLVEDDPLVRRATARTLRQSGYGVVEACDGAEASELMATSGGRFSLVVSDIVMPRMNGIQLASVLRSRCPEAKIVFVTGYSERLDEANDVGAANVLIKPFHPTELVNLVRRTLSA